MPERKLCNEEHEEYSNGHCTVKAFGHAKQLCLQISPVELDFFNGSYQLGVLSKGIWGEIEIWAGAKKSPVG